MTRIRVLVVEDSATVRRHLCSTIASDPQLELIGEAADGKEAIHLCETRRPDVVTMDMMLPVMTGLGATEYIMAHCPTPILIVSASTNRGEVFKTYEALTAGAVDVLEKPTGREAPGDWERRFLSTLKLVSRVRTVTHLRARVGAMARERVAGAAEWPAEAGGSPDAVSVIAIGASTGGPGAVLDVLRALPKTFSAAVLLVIHINEPFAAAFAEWLDGQTGIRVDYARDGALLSSCAGRVTMAPPDRHLVVRNGRLRLTSDPDRHSCRPSIDVLFESLAAECGPATVACLLTGMGRDGAEGLLRLRQAGAVTIAQDEATSVVYGMPREAALLGAAARVLPLPRIGPLLATLMEGGRVS